MVSTNFISSVALLQLLSALSLVSAVPENCCILGSQFYDVKAVQKTEPCTPVQAGYGTLQWKCNQGQVVYNGHDLSNGEGDDQITMHVDADPNTTNVHFTVMMECTGKSGELQRALPLHCPTLSSKQMVGLGPIFKEPCASAIKVSSFTPLDGFECAGVKPGLSQ